VGGGGGGKEEKWNRLVIVEFGCQDFRARAYGGERRVGHETGAWWWGGPGDVKGGEPLTPCVGGWGWRGRGCGGRGG